MKFSRKIIAAVAAAAVLSVSGVAMAAGRPANDAGLGYTAANANATRTYAMQDGTGLGFAYGLMGGYGFNDANGDGVCDGPLLDGTGNGYGAGNGTGFVDADGDGVCDTCGEVPALDGTGNAYGAGNGSAFVDADGDGVCDSDGVRALDGSGNPNGERGGRGMRS